MGVEEKGQLEVSICREMGQRWGVWWQKALVTTQHCFSSFNEKKPDWDGRRWWGWGSTKHILFVREICQKMQGKNRMMVGGTLGSSDSFVKEGRPECVWGWGGSQWQRELWKWWAEIDLLIYIINIHWAPTVFQALCYFLRLHHE